MVVALLADDAVVFASADKPNPNEAKASEIPSTKRYFVLKAHGTAERPETIVLDTSDYGRLIHNSPSYRTFLRAMFLHRTVLFIGFSMTDPDLLGLLQELKVIFEGNV